MYFTVAGLAFSVFFFVSPEKTYAGVLSAIYNLVNKTDQKDSSLLVNSQNIPLLASVRAVSPELARGGGDITVVGGTALMPESGPLGTMADVGDGTSETISTYVVRKGDTIQNIAKMYGVSPNTLIWANEINGSVIREGQVLVILPISGVQHEVKKGDTIESIAKKYKADPYDVARYNDISYKDILTIGDFIIVPDGEISSPATVIASANKLRGANGPIYEGYYLRPVLAGRKSQGLHGYNAVDLATYSGAPIFASADGEVIVSANGGWNGGYGKYVVISHQNGTQTLYAHNIENMVSTGDHVVRGQIIGLVGSTGKSTGPHVHFEIRGARNPF